MKKLLFVTEALTGGGAESALVRLMNRLPEDMDAAVVTVFPGGEDLCKPDVGIRCLNPTNSPLRFWKIRLLAALGLAHRLWGGQEYDLHIAWMETCPTKLVAAVPGPKVAWVHCDMKNRARRGKMGRWYARFDRAVCVSRDVENAFRRYFSCPTEVIPNVLETKDIVEKSREFHGESFDILTVGRLSPEKGVDRLLDAVQALNGMGCFPTVGVLGDGPEMRNLKNQAAGIPGVKFLGHRENPYPFIRAAKLLAIPSRSEGASTVAQEGLVLGKAILAAPCAGMAEILGDAALITDDLTAGLHRLLTDKAFCAQLEEKAALRALEISPERAASLAADLFRRILKEGGRGG